MPPQPLTASSAARWGMYLVVLALLATNLVPLAGVLYWGWTLGTVMLLFWLDNVAIGLFAVARIYLTPRDRTAHGGLLSPKKHEEYTAGFGFVYFFFTGIHGLFLVIIFPPRFDDPALAFGILALVVSRGFDFVVDYVLPKAYLSADVQDLAFSAILRVLALHLAILGGAFLIAAMKSNAVAALAVLVVLKTAGDLFALYYFRRKQWGG